MASGDLQRLHRLHELDSALLQVRKQAANMDGGKKIVAELEQLNKLYEKVGGHAKALSGEQKDLELANQTIEEKLKKIDKEMYGGSVVNSREVANLEKEIASLKQRRSANDDRLLELMDLVPPAKAEAAKVEKAIAVRRAALDKWKQEAGELKVKLETRFKELTAKRPELVKAVPAPLLARYDTIRQSHGGIGMADVTREHTCGECGTAQPERTLQMLLEEKVVLCDSCKRMLYYTTGLV